MLWIIWILAMTTPAIRVQGGLAHFDMKAHCSMCSHRDVDARTIDDGAHSADSP